MANTCWVRTTMLAGLVLALAGCGSTGSGSANLFSRGSGANARAQQSQTAIRADAEDDGSTIWDLFSSRDDPNITVEVNKYLWQAALEVLDFLPIQSVDPFSGIIVTGFGTPPGGGRAYRATIYVQDPALDARSLKVALQGSGGAAVSAETLRAVEDAILTRARQIRIRDSRL